MRRKCQGHIWPFNRRYDKTITLAPLTKTLIERKEEFSNDNTRAVLSLHLSLTVDSLTDQQIKTMAQDLCKTVKKIEAPVKSIDWEKLLCNKKSPPSFAKVASFVKIARQWARILQSPTELPGATYQVSDEGSSPPMSTPTESTAVHDTSEVIAGPQVPRKRKLQQHKPTELSHSRLKRRTAKDLDQHTGMMTPKSGTDR